MWEWSQAAGKLSRDGKEIASGYAGRGAGVNNPAMQKVVATGPIPQGDWKMTELRLKGASTGPYTIVLEPGPSTQTFGRSAFRIHGDNGAGDRSASHGCIILPRAIREQIWNSGDRALRVTA